jgi:hypothetical protein
LLLEVARAERVDEVVDDLRTFQGGGDAVAARCVSDDVADAGLVTRAARDRGQLVQLARIPPRVNRSTACQ